MKIYGKKLREKIISACKQVIRVPEIYRMIGVSPCMIFIEKTIQKNRERRSVQGWRKEVKVKRETFEGDKIFDVKTAYGNGRTTG